MDKLVELVLEQNLSYARGKGTASQDSGARVAVDSFLWAMATLEELAASRPSALVLALSSQNHVQGHALAALGLLRAASWAGQHQGEGAHSAMLA